MVLFRCLSVQVLYGRLSNCLSMCLGVLASRSNFTSCIRVYTLIYPSLAGISPKAFCSPICSCCQDIWSRTSCAKLQWGKGCSGYTAPVQSGARQIHSPPAATTAAGSATAQRAADGANGMWRRASGEAPCRLLPRGASGIPSGREFRSPNSRRVLPFSRVRILAALLPTVSLCAFSCMRMLY